MKKRFVWVGVLLLISSLFFPLRVQADAPNHERTIVTTVSKTVFEWWLLAWKDDQLACTLTVDHEGWPYHEEIVTSCGNAVYEEWVKQPACSAAAGGSDVSVCQGLYLMFHQARQIEQEVITTLPSPTVSISLSNCAKGQLYYTCSSMPRLQVSANEPVSGESILRIGVKIGTRTSYFPGDTAQVNLGITPEVGTTIVFWAESSLGDSTEQAQALVMVSREESEDAFRAAVLSKNWAGPAPLAFSLEWSAFPSQQLPAWLSANESVQSLATGEPYLYLGGQLINWGLVNAGICQDGGLLVNGYASQCGLDQAMAEIIARQNMYDDEILRVSRETGIPARLLKNIIAQESQFWPAYRESDPPEFGLAQMTEWGAETVLTWDRDYYQKVCTSIYTAFTCSRTFTEQPEEYQQALRGAVLRSLDPTCGYCPNGIDTEKVSESINMLGRALLANAAQVNQMIANLSPKKAGELSSYEDLWRFTLANYNAGPGCLFEGIEKVLSQKAALTWEALAENFSDDCDHAIEYVAGVTRERWPTNIAEAPQENVTGVSN